SDQKRIHTLLRELQSLIKNAQEQWGISLTGQGTVNDKLKAFAPVANAVHPLGPVNIVGLSTEFSQKIALIRSTISNFRNTTVHDISQLNLSIGTDPLLKKYQLALQEESLRLNTVSEVRENIRICKELALDTCQNKKGHGSTLRLAISGSICVMDFLQQPKDGSHTSANIQFVLWLCPPVYVADTVAKEIEDLICIVMPGFFGSRIMTDDPKSLSLEELL
ncbi:16721_t:CDS:2, partial [Racocetra fulgida]